MGGSFPAILGNGVGSGKRTFIQRGRTKPRRMHPRRRRHHAGMADRAALLDWIGVPEAREALLRADCAPRAVTALRDAFTAG
ncbi:MAG: hypothetical protein J0M02_17055, partial [Planctomycetes bacterium]|nr:hypothetical protein [Planctomycetota bacterium]